MESEDGNGGEAGQEYWGSSHERCGSPRWRVEKVGPQGWQAIRDLLVTYLCLALFCKGLEAAYTYTKIYHGTNTTTTESCPWGLHRSDQEEQMAREERPKVLSCLLELPMAKY